MSGHAWKNIGASPSSKPHGVKAPRMIETSSSIPDPGRPHCGRVHDYLLSGKDYYPPDQEVGAELVAKAGEFHVVARAARRFLLRAVQNVASEGVDQFVELGSGYPCHPNVHEVVQLISPDARTVYIDNDPIVAAHGRALLAGTHASVEHADITDTNTTIAHIDAALNLAEPVALCAGFVLEFVAEPRPVMRSLIKALPAGSYVVLSHITADITPDIAYRAAEIYGAHKIGFTPRDRGEIADLLEGCELVDPGLVAPHRWRPDGEFEQRRAEQMDWSPPIAAEVCCYAAVGRVR
ncbi:SAM-dependent methyltransferase [Nocardia amikacinitolerans]|uniref:SAM-dependent methyltransferase n=1 Tax=Nocardia amikacinitolerans TaxID=756689 RepID=UPI0036BD9D83